MILVVEDDASLCELMRRQLHRAGWAVAEAENGRVALAHLAEIRPAVILPDHMFKVGVHDGVKRTRKFCRAQPSSLTMSRIPSFHVRMVSLSMGRV